MMGIGMMIGAGVFLGIGNAIYYTGPGGVILTFALNGVVALFTAMSYAELSSAVPRAGGAYNFARIGFGRNISFHAGWMEWFASSIAGSAYAITFAIYVWRYIKGIGILEHLGSVGAYIANDIGTHDVGIIQKVTALLIAVLFIYINFKGASQAGKIGAFFAFGQTIFLLFIGVVGIIVVLKDPSRFANFSPFLPKGWVKLFVTMGFTYVAFEGFEVIAQAGDETINPRQNLPKAMIYSVFAVTITYVLVAFASVVAVKTGDPGIEGPVWEWIGSFRAEGFGEAVGRIMPYANFFLTLAVIFASTSALNATVFSATRAAYALGRDGMLPSTVAKVGKKNKVPYVALLLTGGILILVAVALDALNIASTASIMFLFLFFLVNVCAIKIRRNMADELKYGFMTPLFPLFPVVAIICQVIMVFHLHEVSRASLIIGPSWILVGIIVYHFYSKSHAKTSDEEVVVIEDEHEGAPVPEGEKRDYHVMVAVANPDTAIDMVRTTYTICQNKNADLDLIHVVSVPSQIPLSDADRYMLEGKQGIIEMMISLINFVPVNTGIRYCRSISRGIVSAVREKDSDLLIMGWHGKKTSWEFGMGSTIDPILERSPSNVIILKDMVNKVFKNILVPVAGGVNSAFALEVGTMLADKNGGRVVALNVDTGKYDFDFNELIEKTEKNLYISRDRIELKIIKSQDLITSILNESEEYDLVVIGCTHKKAVQQFWTASIPENVAQKCKKPIAMVRSATGIRSWIRKWI
jgi:amino acid transporter/nucleotide-binding universal stress UspA family protein